MTTPPLALAAVLASALAVRAPSPRQTTIAVSLAALLAVNIARPLLAAWLPVYAALFIAWYAVQTWTVGRILDPSGPRTGQAFALLVASAGVALQLELTGELARASFALALAAQILACVRFVARGRRPDDAQRVAIILAASTLADAFGPWLAGQASKDWHVGRAVAVATWMLVALDQGRAMWRERRWGIAASRSGS